MKNKKANTLIDTITLIALPIGFAIICLIGYVAFTDINTDIQANNDNVSKELSQDLYDRYPSTFDGLFIFMIVILYMGAIVLSFMIDTHPIMFALTILLLFFVLGSAMIVSNTYQTITADSDFYTPSLAFPMTNYIISHLLETILVMAGGIALVQFGKQRYL